MLASRPTILVSKKSIAGFLLSVSRTGFAKLLKHLHPPPIRTSYAFCDYSPRLPSVCLFFPLFLLLLPPPPPLRSSSNIHLLLVSFPSSSFSVSIEMPTRQRSMCLSCISIRDLSHYCIYILRIAISVCISIYLSNYILYIRR